MLFIPSLSLSAFSLFLPLGFCPVRVFRSRCTFPDATGSHVAIETCTADACARACVRAYIRWLATALLSKRRIMRANTIIITLLIVIAN